MAKIRIDLSETLLDGMDIKFKAPCACHEVDGLTVYYPTEDETVKTKDLAFRDAHGNDLTGVGNLFVKDAYVKVIVDSENGYAYPQNADTNGYLNSAIFGTYTHDAENLIGRGENGKFKATVSGTISSINVNGVSCSVKCGEDSTMDLVAGCWYTFILDGNVVNFSSGGAGGAGLNFKVVGGTTAPVSPSENMIWVNTDTPITGYEFTATEPVSSVQGMIWISTGSASSAAFSATKKNPVMIYPLTAKQYVSGAWVEKTAKSYQGGEWVSWVYEIYLYDNGAFSDSIGELVQVGMKEGTSSGYSGGTCTITKNANSVKISSHGGKGAIAYFPKKIDLTSYKNLYFKGSTSVNRSSNNGRLVIGVWKSFGSTCDDNKGAALEGEMADGLHPLSISTLEGEYYVGIFVSGFTDYVYATMKELYLK